MTRPLTELEENYYQISEAVLSSFPKYRLPLDLFVFNETVKNLQQFYKKDNRLSNEQIEQMQELCANGVLFVSRTDFPVYSHHIVKQLDLVLVDDNLKEGEIAELILQALGIKLNAFLEQPVKLVFEPLFSDVMVFTEYLWGDKHRIKLFMRRLYQGEHSLIKHSINTLMVGLWMLFNDRGDGVTRKDVDNYALGLLLHDAGMSKVPAFITSKTKSLTAEERGKIPGHVMAGAQILQKMELVEDELKALCFEHHERHDGSGYPQKLNGALISRAGALCAVADSFSAMIQKRPYAEAKEPVQAAKELMDSALRYDKQLTMALYSAFFNAAAGK